VAEPVGVIRVLGAMLVERDTAGDAADVGMRSIDAAVDDSDAKAVASQHGNKWR